MSEQTALGVLGISRATYYRWKTHYQQFGKKGRESKSCRPHQRRRPAWDKALEQQILALRKQDPLWDKLKLVELMPREYRKTVVVSMVGCILKALRNQGKIKPVTYFCGHTHQRRARSFHNHSQRWRQGMKAKKPG